MSHDANKVVKCCKGGESGDKRGVKLVNCFTFTPVTVQKTVVVEKSVLI